MRSRVDFPDPEVPTIAVIEPLPIDIDTESTTVIDPYCFVRASMLIIVPPDS
jgi:hypothetical protein